MMFTILIAAMSLAVLIGAICRLDTIFIVKHKVWWGIMYICYAAFAAACAAGATEESSFFGLAACGLNLLLTKHLWAEGPPATVERP
jgi:hypothetical protein